MTEVVVTELTSERLFQAGEFKQQLDRELVARHGIKCFPNQIWWRCCFQSQSGTDFSLSVPVLQLLRRLENEGYIATCHRAGGRPELKSYCTLAEQEQKLDNVEPRSGQMGAYYWIDENGDPTQSSKRQAPDEWM